MGELGLFGLVVPEAYGGSLEDADGGAFTSLCIAIEELGRVDQSIGITLSAGVGLGINPILTYGTDAQKERFLPDLVAGRALAGFGLTEPDAGSDAGATRTKAVLDERGVGGRRAKAFITNSGTDITSVVTVTARTGTDADGRPEISAIMIPSGTPGFTVERPTTSSAGTSRTRTACPSPAAACPRRTCSGSAATASASSSRPSTTAGSRSAALALGLITRMREEATAYAKTRTGLRAADRGQPGGRVPHRRPARDGGELAPADLPRGVAQGRAGGRAPLGRRGQAGGGDRQALHLRGRRHGDPDRHAGLRRQRLHGGVPRRPLLPRRQDPRDR
jgi:alkylation response protein AidB-like acyl-CoA dehydrogenase